MTKSYWMLALILLSGCTQYQPLYQAQSSAESAHHRIMLTHVQDESVSELGRLLSELLSSRYGQHDSPSHLLEANLKDVTIVTSPVQPGPSSLRSYSVRARLALTLKDIATTQHHRATLREEADFPWQIEHLKTKSSKLNLTVRKLSPNSHMY